MKRNEWITEGFGDFDRRHTAATLLAITGDLAGRQPYTLQALFAAFITLATPDDQYTVRKFAAT